MKYGQWETTQNIERRGKYHTIYAECVCSCGTRRYVATKNLKDGSSQSCGCVAKEVAPRAPTHFYVRMVGSQYPRYAVGEPDVDNPWRVIWSEPPVGALQMTRQEAETWKIRRIKYRAQWGAGQYQIVEL